MRLLFAILIASLVTQAANACPSGPNDSELTLAQIMINFGKLTLEGDKLIREGVVAPEDITDERIKTAQAGVTVARGCSQILASDTAGKYVPLKAKSLEGQARAEYMGRFLKGMQEFTVLIQAYEDHFTTLLGRTLTKKDFEALYAKRKAVFDKATVEHEALQ